MFVYLYIQHSLTSICYFTDESYQYNSRWGVASWNAGQVIFVFILWDRDEMSNFYIRPSIVAFTKFWFIWLRSFRGEYFKNLPIRNKNRLWRPCLLTDRDEMSNHYRGPSIDASYLSFTSFGWGVSEEKNKMWKVNRWQTTDDGRQVMVKAHIAFGKVSLQQSLGRYVAPLGHIILIPSQPVFALSP